MGCTTNLCLVCSSNNLGVVTLGDILYGLHNTLDIYDHGINYAGHNSGFLLQKVSRKWYSVAH